MIIPRSPHAHCSFSRGGKVTDLAPSIAGQAFVEAIVLFQSSNEATFRVHNRDVAVSQGSKSPERVVLKIVDAQRHMPAAEEPDIPCFQNWLTGFADPGLNIICGMPGSGRRTIADATIRQLIQSGQPIRMFDREKPGKANPRPGDVLVAGAIDADSFSPLVDHATTNPVLAILGARSAKDGVIRLRPALRKEMGVRVMELSLVETPLGDFRLQANLMRFGER